MRGMAIDPDPRVAQTAHSATWDGPTPTISVLISTFRRPQYLAELIVALEAQSLATDQFEVVLVDNGSNDSTWTTLADLVAATPLRLCVAQVAENRGPASGRNAAVVLARSELVAFTDDDCLPESGWVAAMLEALRNEARIAQGRTEPVPGPTDLWDHTIAVRTKTNLFETCNLGYRRDDVIAAGGLTALAGFRAGRGGQPFGGEDTLLGWSIVRSTGAEVAFASDAVVQHRIEPRNFRGWLHVKAGTWIFIALVENVPELRDDMVLRVFLNRRSASFDAAVIALVASVVFRTPVFLLAGVPYLWQLLPQHRGGLRRWLRRLPGTILGDAAIAWSLLRGSIRHRRIVL